MARRLRFHKPSAIYHVMLRGNDGQPIFFSDVDRCRMCLLLQEGSERFGHTIHSFCFMTNHIHLAIQVSNISISRIIQNLAFRYASYINKKYGRIGHLFQGRFKSILVDENRYFKELIRYIHLNPVRANLVDLPEKYEWSSHRACLFLDEYTWLKRQNILKKFGSSIDDALVCYESFILKGIGIQTDVDFKTGSSAGILGDEEFIDDFLETIKVSRKIEVKLPELFTKVCNHFSLTEEAVLAPGKNRIASQARAVLALLVLETSNLSLEELAVLLSRDSSGLSKLAKRLEKKCILVPTLAAEIDVLRQSICKPIDEMSECQA